MAPRGTARILRVDPRSCRPWTDLRPQVLPLTRQPLAPSTQRLGRLEPTPSRSQRPRPHRRPAKGSIAAEATDPPTRPPRQPDTAPFRHAPTAETPLARPRPHPSGRRLARPIRFNRCSTTDKLSITCARPSSITRHKAGHVGTDCRIRLFYDQGARRSARLRSVSSLASARCGPVLADASSILRHGDCESPGDRRHYDLVDQDLWVGAPCFRVAGDDDDQIRFRDDID